MSKEKTLTIIKDIRKKDIIRVRKFNIIGKEIYIPTTAGESRALIYKARNKKKLAPIFFNIHGGGFVGGMPEYDDKFCDALRNELDITVISIGHRLAPEFKWPNGINDIYDTVSYVSSHNDEFGINSECMAIGGHSSGANIAAVVCMKAKENKEFSFKCQVLDYPVLDLATQAGEKFYVKGAIPPEISAIFDKCYRHENVAKHPHCSPVFATNEQLKSLPPAIIITCEIDSLRDEGEKYAQKLIGAGVETTAKRFYGVNHGFTIAKPHLPESKEAYGMIADGLRKYLLD